MKNIPANINNVLKPRIIEALIDMLNGNRGAYIIEITSIDEHTVIVDMVRLLLDSSTQNGLGSTSRIELLLQGYKSVGLRIEYTGSSGYGGFDKLSYFKRTKDYSNHKFI